MDEIDAALAEQDRLARQVEEAVRDSIDPYPFALEMLGRVFRGALSAGGMGQGTESETISEMATFCTNHLAAVDLASLPLLEGNAR